MKPRKAALASLLLLVALAAADCRTATKKSAARPDEAKTAAPSSPEALRLAMEKVGPLHKKMGPQKLKPARFSCRKHVGDRANPAEEPRQL